MVKVISGIYKGRNLITPKSDTKPTKGSVKEAIFSSLGENIKNSSVLDLFSGSGAFGIEALSRGASKCIFNDLGKEQYQILNKNISNLGISNKEIYNLDYKVLLNKLDLKFDIVFIDPPYKMNCYKEIINILLNKNMLNDNSIIILESNHSLDLDVSDIFNIKEKKYGYTIITILYKI